MHPGLLPNQIFDNGGMSDPLAEYRRKRRPDRTAEPMPTDPLPAGQDDTFVIQQHHARRLHWDLRFERGGALVSWALPRGVPRDPARNHLAVRTEDHPLAYAQFQGEIPAGEYGAGQVLIYDRGNYTAEKWREDEVVVTMRGQRVIGRYALFQTTGKNWLIHRMDPPEPGWTPMPEQVAPMRPSRARQLPADDAAWGYEMTWDGVRAIGYVAEGRLRLESGAGEDLTGSYPAIRRLADALAPTECLLDGTVVTLDGSAHYLLFDLLWLDGRPTMDLSYQQRRNLLTELELAGPHWRTPPHFTGDGRHALATSAEQGLPGVTAKRLDSPYLPGRRTRRWLVVEHA